MLNLITISLFLDIEQKNVNFSNKISSQWNLDPIDNGRERYNAKTKYELVCLLCRTVTI